ncbi:MAG: hypothetical protein ACPGVB_02690 [Chitinophagales bacterium]
MSKKSTVLDTSIIVKKIADLIDNNYREFPEKEKYNKLSIILKRIAQKLELYKEIDVRSNCDIDYRKTIPEMAKMVDAINSFDIEQILDHWHQNEHTSEDTIDEKITLCENFEFYIQNNFS